MISEGEAVREGFICPLCMEDLEEFLKLESHFVDRHSKDQELQKLFPSFNLKELFGKAKKKTLNAVAAAAAESDNFLPAKLITGYQPSSPSEVSLGATQSHTSFFREVRTLRIERYAVQTNHLIRRLQKLLQHLPSDPLKRKSYEQNIVPWVDEKDVKLCPGCAKTFGLLRRKHHCRLCGGVMCNECTLLLSFDDARKMVDMPETTGTNSEEKLKKLQKASSAAVQSVLSLDYVNELHFRICEYCNNCLYTREKIKESRNQKPIICQFYERLSNYIKEADDLVTAYNKMYSSIINGETIHNLAEAQGIRVKLLKSAENIDATSKKICVLGQNADNPPQGIQLRLQQTIRTAATIFLKEKVIGLPSLPTEEQLKAIQEKRRMEIDRRLEEEDRRSNERNSLSVIGQSLSDKMQRSSNSPLRQGETSKTSAGRKEQKQMSQLDSFTPDISVGIESDHPLITQMNIVKECIKQAGLAGKFDEVAILEDNLQELKEEYFKQSQRS